MKKCCCCCGSAFITIVLLIIAVVVGGSFYFFNAYVKPIVQISLPDTIGIYNSLHKGKESAIVTSPYDAVTDLAKFEAGFREALFISEDSDFSIKDVINEALSGLKPQVPETTNEKTIVNQASIANNNFLSFLEKINFDFSSLTNYQGDTTKGVLSVNDKEVAAMVNLALESMIAQFLPNGIQGVNLTDVVSLKQVVVNAADDNKLNDRLTMTIKFELRKLVLTAINKMGEGGGSMATVAKLVKIIDGLIPKDIFLSLTIAPYNATVVPTFKLNQFKDKTHNNTITMINGILNYINKTENVDQLGQMLNGIDVKIKAVFNQIDKYVALDFEGSSAKMDAMNLLLTSLKLDGLVTKVDLLYMVSYINCRDLSAYASVEHDKEAAGQFITKFKKNYGVDENLNITTDSFLNDLGKTVKHVDANNVDLETHNDNIDTMLIYDALIDIISSSIKNQPTEPTPQGTASGTKDIISKIDIKSLMLNDSATDELKMLIKLPIRAIVSDMMGEDSSSLIKHFSGQLLPEIMYLEVSIQLNGDKVELLVNGLGEVDSRTLFKTIYTMMVSFIGESKAAQFSYDGLCELLSTEVKAAIDKVEKNPDAPIDLVFTDDGVDLPTVFELMQLLLDIEGEVDGEAITPDIIRQTIKGSKELDTVKSTLVNTSTEVDELQPFAIAEERVEVVNVNGKNQYFASGKPQLSITDQAMNQNAKESISTIKTKDYELELLQTMFADLSPTAAPQSLLKGNTIANGFFTDKLAGFDTNSMVMTIIINFKKNADSGNNMSAIPDILYATIVLDISDLETGKMSFYINDMKLINTLVIEKMMSSLAKQVIKLEDIVREMIEKFQSNEMQIEYSKRDFEVPGIGVIKDVNFQNESLTVSDITSLGIIENGVDMTDGVGRFILDKTVQIDVTDLVEELIASQFPGGIPPDIIIPDGIIIPSKSIARHRAPHVSYYNVA